MAEKAAESLDREIKLRDPGKKPFIINIFGKSFKGNYQKIVGQDDKGKPTVEVVESKTRIIPAALAKGIDEKFLVPLKTAGK